MEAVASIFTLVQAAAFVSRATRDVSRKFRDAPRELEALAAQSLIVLSELENVQHASQNGHASLVTVATQQDLKAVFTNIQVLVDRLDEICEKSRPHGRFRVKARWALKEQQHADRILLELDQQRDLLYALLQQITL